MTDKKQEVKTEEKKDVKAAKRPARKPLHTRKVLDAQQRPGFVRRWVNEKIGAVEAYKAAGYELVRDDNADISDVRAQTESQMGSVTRRVVNRDPQAVAQTAVLMEIPLEYYLEDQAEKQRMIDEKEAAYNPAVLKKDDPTLYGSQSKKYT